MARAMAVLAVMVLCVVSASAATPAPERVLAEVPSVAPTPSFDGIPDSPAPTPSFGWAPDSLPEGAPVESPVDAPPSWAPVSEPASAPESEGTVGTLTNYFGAP